MNSFTLTAVGNLARNPEAVAKGDVTFTRFCLVGNDYAGKDDEGAPREIVTTLWFVAFGALAESLVRGARKGDQLFVEARVRSNNWTDKQGEKQYDLDFVVQGYRYGAPGKIKREERKSHRQEGTQKGDERGSGRDHEAVAIPDGDGSTANDPVTIGNVGATQSSSSPAGKPAEKAAQTAADKGSEKGTGTPGEKLAARAGEKAPAKAGESLAEKAPAKAGESLSEKASARAGESLAEKASTKAAESLGEKASAKVGERPGEKPAEKPVEKTNGPRAGRRAAALAP